MYILGISAFYHDAAAALIYNEEIMAAAQEERFTRKKQDASFPINAIKFCLDHSGLSLNDLDAIVFYDKPLLKFERLLETYYAFAPKGLISFLAAIPIWAKEKIFLKRLIYNDLAKVGKFKKEEIKLLFSEHHLSHAASTFYPSSFKESAILTIDGVGEWATASICHGKGNNINILKELNFPHSVGLLYSAFTYFLGFKVNSGEYKLMGLAPYGNSKSDSVKAFIKLITDNIVNIKQDGSIQLNQKYFDYATGLKMIKKKKWEKMFGMLRRNPDSDILQAHCDLALAIQKVTEDIVLKMAKEAKRITGANNLCLAGGVALNCVANGKLVESKIFDKIFVQPAAGDAGGALGAAYAVYYNYFNKKRTINVNTDKMQGAFLGPEFYDIDIKKIMRKFKAPADHYNNFDELCKKVAELLDKGSIIGWMQGKMEYGPRALGNRSILGDARNPEMQKKLNLKIKFRESFRPFAPSILKEDVNDYFDHDLPSPYMLFVTSINKKRRNQLPDNFYDLSVKEKLYFTRSDVPAITHLDYSARIQTVDKTTNEKYWKLIHAFKKRTSYSLIVNTSFNVRGEPIVCTPEDAYKCFMRTEMDYLVMGNYLFDKKRQAKLLEEQDWKKEYVLD